MNDEVARVATGVLVLDEHDRVLLARRNSAHKATAPDTWGTPGGKVDRGEAIEACMLREAVEELGEPLDAVTVLPLVTSEPYELAHYYCFWGIARIRSRGRDALDFIEVNDQGIPKILGRWTFFTQEQARGLRLMGWTQTALNYHNAGRTDFVIVNPKGPWPGSAG